VRLFFLHMLAIVFGTCRELRGTLQDSLRDISKSRTRAHLPTCVLPLTNRTPSYYQGRDFQVPYFPIESEPHDPCFPISILDCPRPGPLHTCPKTPMSDLSFSSRHYLFGHFANPDNPKTTCRKIKAHLHPSQIPYAPSTTSTTPHPSPKMPHNLS
jgi:hypothetical protein